ncbi:MAG: sodium:solute symporter, partial [Actinobacteria bacterium]|nr:sodium:solute symporter [Actinomycetota bacterium]
VPDLFLDVFPSWFVGVAFAAIAIGALVPAAVMSIAAANLFTRSIYKEYLRPDASHADEARTAKIVSLLVKVGALVIIVTLPTKYAIELQLLGGVWILQTLPAIVVGLYSRWLHRWALVAGWAVGMTVGTLMAASQDFAPTYPLELLGTKINAYTGVFALAANLVVTLVLTLVLRAGAGVPDDGDETQPKDYDELAEDAVYPPAGASPAPAPSPAA